MKVKLQEVLEALDGVGMDMEYYYDTKNEEILMIFDGMVNGCLLYTSQARRHIPMTMEDWKTKLDAFLRFNDADVLQDKGCLLYTS